MRSVFVGGGAPQLRRATSQLVSKYRAARMSVREAAAAAETVGERVIKGDELKVTYIYVPKRLKLNVNHYLCSRVQVSGEVKRDS